VHGLEVVGFPCNQFGGQEPGTAQEIKAFARARGARFRLTSKVDVNGPATSSAYRFLKDKTGSGDLTWNFGM